MTRSNPSRTWSDVFRRSEISPFVFVVSKDGEKEVEQVLARLDLPKASSVELYENTHWAWPLLDGAVAKLLTYGLPALPSGMRVYGHRPMRLLCHLMELRPPTRLLSGEQSVPDTQQLLSELERQQHRTTNELLDQAREAMANDREDVLLGVRALFGEQAAPAAATS